MPYFETRNSKPLGSDLPANEMYDSSLIKLAFSAPRELFEPGLIATIRVMGKQTRKIMLSRTTHKDP